MSALRTRIEGLLANWRGAVTTGFVRALVQVLLELERRTNISPGPGLTLRSAGGGQELRITRGGASEPLPAPPEVVGDETELGHEHGARDTDTWVWRDAKQAALHLVTDLWYDDTDHRFLMRARPVTISASGRVMAIGAESDPATVVVELVECEAQPD